MPKRTKAAEPDLELLPGVADKIEHRAVEDLVPYGDNPWDHPESQIDKLAAGIARLGFNQPILVHGAEIVAGHGRLLAAKRLGLKTVPVISLDHLDDDTARAYRIADNKLGELAEVDEERLEAELSALEDLDLFELSGFELEELEELRGEEPGAGEADPEDDPNKLEPIENPILQVGDLLEIGEHRLIVGDAFDDEVRGRLLEGKAVDAIVTDPPYAIFGSSTGVSSEVADDKMVRPFFRQVLDVIGASLKSFGHAYTFTDWRSWASFHSAGRTSKLTLCNLLIWDKGDYGLGSNFRNCHELIGYWQKLPKQKSHRDKRPSGQRPIHEPNILRHQRTRSIQSEGWEEGMDRHSAAKPPGLLGMLIRYSTDEGERVLDPMVGTGSTLIACHRNERRGLGIEIEPKWAEVAIRRLESVSGEQARLAVTGQTLEELAKVRGS